MITEKELITKRELTATLIRERRVNLGWTQEQLAEITGFERANISRIEAGRYFLSTKQLWILCDALDLDVKIIEKKLKE